MSDRLRPALVRPAMGDTVASAVVAARRAAHGAAGRAPLPAAGRAPAVAGRGSLPAAGTAPMRGSGRVPFTGCLAAELVRAAGGSAAGQEAAR